MPAPIKDWRGKVVGYRDIEAANSENLPWIIDNPFVRDAGALKAQLAALDAAGGGDEPSGSSTPSTRSPPWRRSKGLADGGAWQVALPERCGPRRRRVHRRPVQRDHEPSRGEGRLAAGRRRHDHGEPRSPQPVPPKFEGFDRLTRWTGWNGRWWSMGDRARRRRCSTEPCAQASVPAALVPQLKTGGVVHEAHHARVVATIVDGPGRNQGRQGSHDNGPVTVLGARRTLEFIDEPGCKINRDQFTSDRTGVDDPGPGRFQDTVGGRVQQRPRDVLGEELDGPKAACGGDRHPDRGRFRQLEGRHRDGHGRPDRAVGTTRQDRSAGSKQITLRMSLRFTPNPNAEVATTISGVNGPSGRFRVSGHL